MGSGPAFFGVVGKRTRFLDLEKKLMSIVTPVLNKLGYELVQIKVFSKGRVRVQVMVEPLDCSKILLEECALVSREISAILDFEDNFNGPFELEVSSPGIDRPLVKKKDFERFSGFEVKVELNKPLNGRRRFNGTLLGIENESVKLVMHNTEYCFHHENILKSKLVLTDQLLATHEKGKFI